MFNPKTINEYMKHPKVDRRTTAQAKVKCRDGFSMLVHTRHLEKWPYTHITLRKLSGYQEALRPFYRQGWFVDVPVEVVDAIIESHGGFA